MEAGILNIAGIEIMKGSIKTKLDEAAYARDGFKCVECDRDVGIEAHHIIPGLEKLDNLITLYHACHKKRHNMAGCFKKGHKGYNSGCNTGSFKKGHIPWNKGSHAGSNPCSQQLKN